MRCMTFVFSRFKSRRLYRRKSQSTEMFKTFFLVILMLEFFRAGCEPKRREIPVIIRQLNKVATFRRISSSKSTQRKCVSVKNAATFCENVKMGLIFGGSDAGNQSNFKVITLFLKYLIYEAAEYYI